MREGEGSCVGFGGRRACVVCVRAIKLGACDGVAFLNGVVLSR
jgi:hypothetical protein